MKLYSKDRREMCGVAFIKGASAIAIAAGFLAAPAQAQTGDAASQEVASAESAIIVTGSRVISNGFQAPTPVNVVSSEELQTLAPSSLSDALNKLPVFQNSAQPQYFVGASAGQSFLNLRSLGPERVLILLDGRRVVPSTANGTTDVNILPEAMVKRVEVVTGGASAAYGSDAVAGVVNFILDTDYRGIKGAIQAGVAESGLGENYKANLSAGVALGDRGSLIVSGQYYKNEGVKGLGEFDWFDSCALIPNPAGSPQNIAACGVRSAAFTSGGIITGGPLAGTDFGPGGAPRQFVYGDERTGFSMIGGSGVDHGANFFAVPKTERYTGFAHLKYDVADNVTAYVEGLYGQSKSQYNFTASWQGLGTEYQIQIDNAYLPQSIYDRMVDEGITSFPLSRYSDDFGLLENNVRNRTWRVTAGLDIKLGNWDVNAYYAHGENRFDLALKNNVYINRLYNAADVVDGPNGPICRSTLTQPGNGCVPLNLFGQGSPSQAALDYVTGTTRQWVHVKQDVFELSAAGDAFDLWAGPVSVAVGAGYRKESSVQTVDDTSTGTRVFTGGYIGWPPQFTGALGAWERTNPQPLAGEYDVKEVFGEVLIPLLRDSAIGYSADLNGAIRYTDYSTSGGVTTWKVGLTYEPIPDLRFRAARSRDIRAANVTQMFTGASSSQGGLTDPFQPVGSPNRIPVVNVLSFGNPDLRPEVADTTTLGLVLRPTGLPGFSASVDYFDIKIKDAIGTLGGQVTVNQCFEGATELCSLLTRDSNGVLLTVATPFLNIAERATRGLDFEVAYVTSLGNGRLGLRALATYVDRLTTTNPGAPTLDTAGQTGVGGGGGANPGVPHWSGNMSISYDVGGFGIDLLGRYIGPGVLDVNLGPEALDPALNHVDAAFYADLTLSQKLGIGGAGAELFLTVNNLFDRAPNYAPNSFFVFGTYQGATNPGLFDLMGRQYTAGIRFEF